MFAGVSEIAARRRRELRIQARLLCGEVVRQDPVGSGYGCGVLGGTIRGIRGKQIGLVTMVDRIHRVIDRQMHIGKTRLRKGRTTASHW